MIIKRQTVAYSDFIQDVETGDVILMHGQYKSSHWIEFFEGVPWSHSAMLIRSQDIGIEDPDNTILIWEANLLIDEIEDVILCKSKDGPMLVRLHDRIHYNFTHNDDSMFAIRHLYTERTPDIFKKIKDVIQKTHDAHFPSSTHEIGNFLEGRFKNKPSKNGTFFCSQLLSHTFMEMGLLSKNHPDNSFAPADFSEKMDISLQKRAWLGKEMVLDVKTI